MVVSALETQFQSNSTGGHSHTHDQPVRFVSIRSSFRFVSRFGSFVLSVRSSFRIVRCFDSFVVSIRSSFRFVCRFGSFVVSIRTSFVVSRSSSVVRSFVRSFDTQTHNTHTHTPPCRVWLKLSFFRLARWQPSKYKTVEACSSIVKIAKGPTSLCNVYHQESILQHQAIMPDRVQGFTLRGGQTPPP